MIWLWLCWMRYSIDSNFLEFVLLTELSWYRSPSTWGTWKQWHQEILRFQCNHSKVIALHDHDGMKRNLRLQEDHEMADLLDERQITASARSVIQAVVLPIPFVWVPCHWYFVFSCAGFFLLWNFHILALYKMLQCKSQVDIFYIFKIALTLSYALIIMMSDRWNSLDRLARFSCEIPSILLALHDGKWIIIELQPQVSRLCSYLP